MNMQMCGDKSLIQGFHESRSLTKELQGNRCSHYDCLLGGHISQSHQSVLAQPRLWLLAGDLSSD